MCRKHACLWAKKALRGRHRSLAWHLCEKRESELKRKADDAADAFPDARVTWSAAPNADD